MLWFALLLTYDTVEVIARRLFRRKSPFQASREHLHHVFLLAVFSVSETVLTMGAITLLGVLVGIATAKGGDRTTVCKPLLICAW